MICCDECGAPIVQGDGGGKLEGVELKADLCRDHLTAWRRATTSIREEFMTKLLEVERRLFPEIFKRRDPS